MNSFKIIIQLLLIIFPVLLSGSTLDSISMVIDNTVEDSTLLRLYNELTVFQIDNSFEEANSTIEKADSLARKLDDKTGKAIVLYNKGRNLAIHSHYDEAKLFIQEAIELLGSDELLSEKLVSAYIVLGWVHDKLTDYYNALVYFKKASEIATGIQYPAGMASSFINIGQTNNKLGNEDQALEYYEKAKEIYSIENNKLGLLYYYNNIGYIFYDNGDYNNALLNYNQANDLSIELELIRMESHVSQNMILTLTELNRIDEAKKLYDHVFELDTKRDDKSSLAYLATAKIKIELKQKNTEFDINSLVNAYKVGVETKDLELQKISADLLAKVYEIKGDFRNALKQSTLSSNLKDSISNDEMKLRIKNLEASKKLELKEKDALILESNLKKSLERQSLIKKVLILPLIILSVLLFFLHRAYKFTVDSQIKLQLNNAALQQTELKLEKQNEDLKKYIDQNIELEQFAHIASHDIKSPLRTISSFTGLIRKQLDDKLSDKQKDYFNHVEQGIKRLDYLVDDLLKFSVENALQLEMEEVTSEEVFSEVLENLASDINTTSAEVVLDSKPQSFKADKIKLKQIVQNLISNSIKFRSSERPIKITINCNVKDEYCYISVADNGIGMCEKYTKKVFEKFFQLNSKDEYEGTGLGLSLCQKYVQKHNGKIWIDSQLGKGTKITFSLAQETI